MPFSFKFPVLFVLDFVMLSFFVNDEMLEKKYGRVYLIYMPQHTLHSRKSEENTSALSLSQLALTTKKLFLLRITF